MIKKIPKQPNKFPLYATLFTILGVIILCSLGTWQIKRLQWKNTIIAQLEEAYATPQSSPLKANESFSYGQISGQWLSDKALLVKPRTQDGKIGAHVIVPLQTPTNTTLINLGWTDQPLSAVQLPAQNAQVTVTGLARIPYWGLFTPLNSPQSNEWYRLDINEISTQKILTNPAPYILYAEHISGPTLQGFPNTDRWYPKNNHAQYAIFWFSMAGVLIIIYGLRFFKKP